MQLVLLAAVSLVGWQAYQYKVKWQELNLRVERLEQQALPVQPGVATPK